MKNIKTVIIPFLAASMICCGGGKKSDMSVAGGGAESIETVLPADEVAVETMTLQTVDFEHELVSNGRLSAQQMAELKFEGSDGGVPVKIFVKNGDHVTAGAAIAMLDTFKLSNSFKTAQDNLQKANLELQDVLIGQGYSIGDTASIPPETLRLAYIRSGYNTAKIQYDLAKYNLDKAMLRTPIAGTVVNLFSKPYCTIDASTAFCKVINEGGMEVDFTILENELPLIKTGDKVQIQSYASPGIHSTGSIANINPSVDVDGTVRIRAYVRHQPQLFNGMNVRISVFRSLGKQWVVPKTAVVLRTGKQVVFTRNSDGTAAWNYVTTGFENATQYTVIGETLKEGDEVIISGNEHLADGTKVRKIEN